MGPTSLLSFLLAVSAAAQVHQGLIVGAVLAADGRPVADAHVSAEVMHGSKILTVLNTNTDDQGIFDFSRLALGKYRIYAEKTEAGYLSTQPNIFASNPALEVTLTPEKSMATTIIHFGPKAASITGWVKDSATGGSVAAHLSLAPTSGAGWSTTGTDGQFKFQLLIPADTPINFGACAEGYKPWSYADASNPSRPIPLQLRPGAALKVDIQLQRNWENPESLCVSGKY